jgi:hypothetical protein
MYCIIKCIVQAKKRVLNRFASSVLHSCNVKTQICVTRPQCYNKKCRFSFFFLFSNEVLRVQFHIFLLLCPVDGRRTVLRFSDICLSNCVVPIHKTLMSVLRSHSVVLETVFLICVQKLLFTSLSTLFENK